MSPPNGRGAGPDTTQVSPTTAQDRNVTTRTRSYVNGSDAADKNAAQATLADAVRDLAHHHDDGRLLDRVAEAVAHLRPMIDAGGLDRVSVVATLTLAAEAACVSRREAEAVIRTELARGAE